MAKKKRRKKRAAGPPPVKQAGQPAVVVDDQQRTAGPGPPRGQRPDALWGSFPLSEIVIAIGIVLLIVGLFLPSDRGRIAVAVGLVLAALGGLALAAREPFTGFRSHTLLRAGGAGVAAIAIVLAGAQTSLPLWVAVLIGVGTGG